MFVIISLFPYNFPIISQLCLMFSLLFLYYVRIISILPSISLSCPNYFPIIPPLFSYHFPTISQ